MKILSKIAAITIVTFFVLSMTASTTLLPNANAHSPPFHVPTFAFCSVSPNPIGAGQTARVNFWIGEPPPTASGQFGDRWQHITVVVTKPDGTTTTLGPFTSDATGGTYTTYTPATIGNYTFQMFFAGQTLAGNNLAPGTPTTGPGANPAIGDIYQPSSSNIFTLTVQQQPIAYSAPTTPLPTSYWTRPIYGENNQWATIAGNWLGTGKTSFANTGMYNSSMNYNPYTTAPTSAHILWTKPEAFGGIIGGEYGTSETSNFYSTAQYEPKFAPIVMNDILYYTQYPGSGSNPIGWVAVDLHTGQTLWTKNTTELLRCGQILDMVTPNQYGALAYLWSEPIGSTVVYEGFEPSVGGSFEMWDALTGSYILTITGVPVSAQPGTAVALTTDDHGNLIGYYVNSTNPFAPTLNMWNSTRCINLAVPNSYGGPNVADNWLWRPPQGASIPFSLGIQWTKPLANNIAGVPIIDFANALYGLGITYIASGVVYLSEYSMGQGLFYQPGWQIEAGYSATTGQQLWITNRTEVPFTLISAGAGTYFAGDGVYVEYTQNALSISCYSLFTGKLLWGPTALPDARPFDSLGGNSVIANGIMYVWAYGGDVYAYNIADGSLKWHYSTPSGGFESPYGTEPLWVFTVGTVAGGELFLPEGHMYSPPLFHGAQQLALNITDGSVVWSIDAFDVTSGPAISDGIATTLNAYDNQIYAYGMGPSKTTVTAPDVGVTTAAPITITGTVMDVSAGSQQNAVAANFPNGLPCVSDASMTQFMESVYMQQLEPHNVTGVPVTFTVIDSNGNYRTIGATNTNGLGDYSFTWKPDIPGNYTVYATFAGTQSYYGSTASTGFYASQPAATAAPTATPLSGLASNTTVMYIGIAIIIVIVIIGAILVTLMLRKRP
ncbi:MAG: PQQ-binding-like beta-propeller repeat protein [Candidatus Bathyarchaeia archaeon]